MEGNNRWNLQTHIDTHTLKSHTQLLSEAACALVNIGQDERCCCVCVCVLRSVSVCVCEADNCYLSKCVCNAFICVPVPFSHFVNVFLCLFGYCVAICVLLYSLLLFWVHKWQSTAQHSALWLPGWCHQNCRKTVDRWTLVHSRWQPLAK